MDLKQIIAKEYQVFLRLAELGSFSKAAERMAIQQAGLSKIIQKLEANLGYSLFFRSVRGVRLTAEGERLLSNLNKVNSFLNEQSLQQEAITLSVGAHASLAERYFPIIFSATRKALKFIQIKAEILPSLQVTEKIIQHQLDIGIVVNPLKNPDLRYKRISSDFVAIYSAQVGINHKILFANPDMYLKEKIISKIKNYELNEVADYHVIAQLAKKGEGCVLLPNKIAKEYNLKIESDKLFQVDENLIWKKENFENPDKKELLKNILNIF